LKNLIFNSFAGVMNIYVSGKQGMKKRKINTGKQNVKTDVGDVLEKNKNIFDHFTSKIQIGESGFALAHNLDDNVKVGALTNFDELLNDENNSEDDEEKRKELEETEGLTVEELEQKKLESFRIQKKKEMEALTAEMNELKGKNFFVKNFYRESCKY